MTIPQILIYLDDGDVSGPSEGRIRWFGSGTQARAFLRNLKAERGES